MADGKKLPPLYERSELLISAEKCERLAAARVLILGVGGVGGYALENMVRAGIGHITIVDGDTVDITNTNRQLSALTSTVGRPKAEVWKERCLEINPDGEFAAVPEFLRSREAIGKILVQGFDFAVDAIDEIGPKTDFIEALLEYDIPFVSSMGAGGKLDPSQIRVADISGTAGCPLARVMRGKLKERGITRKVRCVYSPEIPQRRFADRKIGAISYIPAIFGCFCASEAISWLINEKTT